MNFSNKKSDVHQPKNQRPSEKFQRCSGIFMQLGLVLAMFMVYMALEYSSERNLVFFDVQQDIIDDTYVVDVPNYTVVKKKVKVMPQIDKLKPLDQIIKVDDLTPDPKEIFDPKPSDHEIIPTISSLPHDEGPEDVEPEAVIFILIEDAPVFPGCEGLEKDASKACFTKQITKFVNRKFNASVADGLSLEGRQRITTQFTIDTNGMVTEIKIMAPHKRLEKEARRVIEKLPKMIPGMQRKRPVPVKYTLPIIFDIQ